MKVTVVPAQVTTVEDRIIGNLSPAQVLLIISPVFIGAGIYAVLPPFMEISFIKIVMILLLIASSSVLAVKIKGRMIGSWLIVLLRYALRPKYFVHSKNSSFARDVTSSVSYATETVTEDLKPSYVRKIMDPEVSIAALTAISDPARQIRFKTKRNGELYVHYSKIED